MRTLVIETCDHHGCDKPAAIIIRDTHLFCGEHALPFVRSAA